MTDAHFAAVLAMSESSGSRHQEENRFDSAGYHSFDPEPGRRDREVRKTIQKLARAWNYSVDCDRSCWDFAVQIAELEQDGVSHETLRWMLGKGLIEHAIESGVPRGIGRSFESPGAFAFNSRSCFVLTRAGLEGTARLPATPSAIAVLPARPDPVIVPPKRILLPMWDDQRHELWLGDVLVKRFKWRAANQEGLLAAFQEEGWPARIDDPLPPVAETDSKRRLSDAIKCLNRKQTNPLIRFSGDGTGEGVLWDLSDAAYQAAPSAAGRPHPKDPDA